jgi:hypothetical protein
MKMFNVFKENSMGDLTDYIETNLSLFVFNHFESRGFILDEDVKKEIKDWIGNIFYGNLLGLHSLVEEVYNMLKRFIGFEHDLNFKNILKHEIRECYIKYFSAK